MKKIYNSPKVLVVLMDTQEMVCASDGPNVSINKDGSVAAENVDSRRGSFWDDEEE